jgi:hypothetical protein
MNTLTWIALGGAVATPLISAAGYFIAWGMMKGSLLALGGRVGRLEGEMRALDGLKLDVARLETRLDVLIEQVRDLNAAIRWMREPGGRASRARAAAD